MGWAAGAFLYMFQDHLCGVSTGLSEVCSLNREGKEILCLSWSFLLLTGAVRHPGNRCSVTLRYWYSFKDVDYSYRKIWRRSENFLGVVGRHLALEWFSEADLFLWDSVCMCVCGGEGGDGAIKGVPQTDCNMNC